MSGEATAREPATRQPPARREPERAEPERDLNDLRAGGLLGRRPASAAAGDTGGGDPHGNGGSRPRWALSVQRRGGNRAVGQLFATARGGASSAPGAGAAQVQHRLDGGGGSGRLSAGLTRAAARSATVGAGEAMPHAASIQRAFGRHDISSIKAVVGGEAARAGRAMGARAFTVGERVAFTRSPDLFTAAHEAAHVVQQRSGLRLPGGVGRAGDAHERHADAVAARVVRGQSTEALLSSYGHRGRRAATSSTVQHKLGAEVKIGTPVVRHNPEGDVEGYVVDAIGDAGATYDIRRVSDGEITRGVRASDEGWGTKANQAQSREDFEESGTGEGANYTTSLYMRFNPLLAALLEVHKDPQLLRDPNLQYGTDRETLFARWQAIAKARGVNAKTINGWTLSDLDTTFRQVKMMLLAWPRYYVKKVPGGVVYRGDSSYLYETFKWTNPAGYDTDGLHPLDERIRWQSIMSTTSGDPKTHPYVKSKSIVWHIDLPPQHEGKKLGPNDSESEVTLPVGTALHVSSVYVRNKDKTALAEVFGPDASIIVYAEVTSTAPDPDRLRYDPDGFLSVGESVRGKEDGQDYVVEDVLAGGGHNAWLMRRKTDGLYVVWKEASAQGTRGVGADLMADAEVGASKLASHLIGGYLVPTADRLTIQNVLGTMQPFITSGKGGFDASKLLTDRKQAGQMVAHMIVDWIISNHDAHDGQWLVDHEGNLVGFDKGQAFKHFTEGDVESPISRKAREELATLDKDDSRRGELERLIEPTRLTPGYQPPGNHNPPTMKTFVEGLLKADSLPFDWDDEIIQVAIQNAEALTEKDVEDRLGPYARRMFSGHEAAFYKAVVTRAHRIQDDLEHLFKGKYRRTKGLERKHRTLEYDLSRVPKRARLYRDEAFRDLGSRVASDTSKDVVLHKRGVMSPGTRKIARLLTDFGKYDHKSGGHHVGDLREHSIWVANAIDYMFEAHLKPSSFKGTEKGDTADMFGDYVEHIPPEMRPLLSLTGLLHDVGKAGETHAHDHSTLHISGKHEHPDHGFEIMMPRERRKKFETKSSSKDREDYDYHLRGSQDVESSEGIFDFAGFFKELGLSARQISIVQILTAMHYDFGGQVLRSYRPDMTPEDIKGIFDLFLKKLETVTARTDYGEVDEQLLNMVILIGAADVLGSKPVQLTEEQKSFYDFPDVEPKGGPGREVYRAYGFATTGRLVRRSLLHYFRSKGAKEVQTFKFASTAKEDKGAKRKGTALRSELGKLEVNMRKHFVPSKAKRQARARAGRRLTKALNALADVGVTADLVKDRGLDLVARIMNGALLGRLDPEAVAIAVKERNALWSTLVTMFETSQKSGDESSKDEADLSQGPLFQVQPLVTAGDVTIPDALIEAYRADIADSTAHLSETEGQALADGWNVHARVFTRTRNPGPARRYIDVVSGQRFEEQVETKADGHCLIHALNIILNGANADAARIQTARRLIAENIDIDLLRVQLGDMVDQWLDGGNPGGLGPRTRAYFQVDPSLSHGRDQRRVAALEAKKPKEEVAKKKKGGKKAAKKKAAKKKAVSKPPPLIKRTREQMRIESTVRNFTAHGYGTLTPSGNYGTFQPGRPSGNVVFVNGDHYIVLVPLSAPRLDGPALAGDTRPLGSESMPESGSKSGLGSKSSIPKKVEKVSSHTARKDRKKAKPPKMLGKLTRAKATTDLDKEADRRQIEPLVRGLTTPEIFGHAKKRRAFVDGWTSHIVNGAFGKLDACRREHFGGAATRALFHRVRQAIKKPERFGLTDPLLALDETDDLPLLR